MKTKHLADLEDGIYQWLIRLCEEGDELYDVYVYDNLHVDMAKAAEAVFDANERGQQFLRVNE